MMKMKLPWILLLGFHRSASFTSPIPGRPTINPSVSRSPFHLPHTPTSTSTSTPTSTSTLVLHATPKKTPSESEKGRREEEKRRLERVKDVIIGQTSAKPDAKDLELDPVKTARDLLEAGTIAENRVYLETERGMAALRRGGLDIVEANEAFGIVYALKPEVYLWQFGMVLYYRGEYERGMEILEGNAKIYEERFGERGSEERIWMDACRLKLKLRQNTGQSVTESVESERVSESRDSESDLPNEFRKVVQLTRELFTASVEENLTMEILTRAKLRQLAGPAPTTATTTTVRDPMGYKLSSWYFLGLHHDALGQLEQSKECMRNAQAIAATKGDEDIFHSFPALHMTVRGWMDTGNEVPVAPTQPKQEEEDTEEDIMMQSIMDSVMGLGLEDVAGEMIRKGLKNDKDESTMKLDLIAVLIDELIESLL